jgi:hypothetical protein
MVMTSASALVSMSNDFSTPHYRRAAPSRKAARGIGARDIRTLLGRKGIVKGGDKSSALFGGGVKCLTNMFPFLKSGHA